MIQYVQVKGSAYDMGVAMGKLFKTHVQAEIGKFEEKLKKDWVKNKVALLEQKIKTLYPETLDELYGRADGAGVDRSANLLMFFPEVFKKEDGCTTVIVKNANGNFLFSHNEDETKYSLSDVALVRYDYGDRWIIGYTQAEKLVGPAFSFNSYGLAFSCNYIYDSTENLDNITRYVVIRSVIDSKTVDEVIEKLKKAKVASAFSLNVLDINNNRAINIEKEKEEIHLTEITDRYARSNHFVTIPAYLPDNRINSLFRYEKANELTAKLNTATVKIDDLVQVLSYESGDYFTSIYKDPYKFPDKNVTVANFSVDTESKTIILRDYLGNHILRFGYDGILK